MTGKASTVKKIAVVPCHVSPKSIVPRVRRSIRKKKNKNQKKENQRHVRIVTKKVKEGMFDIWISNLVLILLQRKLIKYFNLFSRTSSSDEASSVENHTNYNETVGDNTWHFRYSVQLSWPNINHLYIYIFFFKLAILPPRVLWFTVSSMKMTDHTYRLSYSHKTSKSDNRTDRIGEVMSA